jgi:ribosomal subunit interface protein
MEIHFKSAHTKDIAEEVTQKVTEAAQRKISRLQKYLGKHTGPIHVYVELGKVTESHQSGKVWRAQINLDAQGKRYHADALGEHIEPAIDTAIKELEAELRKAKMKNVSMLRKGGGALKSFMRGFKAR